MMKDFLANSYLFGGNAPFVEQLYEQWLDDPQAVPAQWREYFERLQRVAHRFLSITDNIGALRMSALCREIEHAARQRTLATAFELAPALREAFEQGSGPRTTGDFVARVSDGLVERMGPVIDELEDTVDGMEAAP